MARQIQLDLLPASPPHLDCSIIHAQSIPSRTVGGDFYDFIPIKGEQRWGMVIADASGKGMPAALMIAQIQAMIRSRDQQRQSDPDHAQECQQAGRALYIVGEIRHSLLWRIEQRDAVRSRTPTRDTIIRSWCAFQAQCELLQIGGPIIGAFPFLEFTSASVTLSPKETCSSSLRMAFPKR